MSAGIGVRVGLHCEGAERMRQRALDELSGALKDETDALRRGWCLGEASFRERVLGLLESAGEKLSRGKAMDGAVRRSHDLEEAERLLRLSLEEVALERSTLSGLKRSDPRKIEGGERGRVLS